MGAGCIDFVLTEHPPAVTRVVERDYEDIRRRLERLAGMRVRSRCYADVGNFDGADAVVLSGSFAPWAVHDSAAITRLGEDLAGFRGPVLGICAGMQLLAMFAGGAVARRARPDVGFGPVAVVGIDGLLAGLGPTVTVYKHHADDVVAVPDEFVVLARSEDCAVEAFSAPGRLWWGTQFHPERFDAEHPDGAFVLRNFFALAGAWEPPVLLEHE
ncbi:MAG: gamma-glutamyl-gamma-aminobutyrate hydrolase family protein [Solirubrobacterales bacterium]|nr:gamma-glutamyl-gamma-aminobutyrate hydrolase family protein [Solirubrobacterales bacterium]